MVERKTIWNDAGQAGLVLGFVSILYFVISLLLGKVSGGTAGTILVGIASAVLWIAKLFLCIFLVRFYMLKFAQANPEADNSDTFKFGCATALLSALIYSAFYYAWVLFIQPDTFSETFALLSDNPMMTEDMLDELQNIAPKMPTISFFVNLIWCFLFGTLVSAVFSRNIPSQNPFKQQ